MALSKRVAKTRYLIQIEWRLEHLEWMPARLDGTGWALCALQMGWRPVLGQRLEQLGRVSSDEPANLDFRSMSTLDAVRKLLGLVGDNAQPPGFGLVLHHRGSLRRSRNADSVRRAAPASDDAVLVTQRRSLTARSICWIAMA